MPLLFEFYSGKVFYPVYFLKMYSSSLICLGTSHDLLNHNAWGSWNHEPHVWEYKSWRNVTAKGHRALQGPVGCPVLPPLARVCPCSWRNTDYGLTGLFGTQLFSDSLGGIRTDMSSPGFLSGVYYRFVHQHPTLHFQLSFTSFIFPVRLLVVHCSLKPFLITSSRCTCMGFPHFLALHQHILPPPPVSWHIIACSAHPACSVQPILCR